MAIATHICSYLAHLFQVQTWFVEANLTTRIAFLLLGVVLIALVIFALPRISQLLKGREQVLQSPIASSDLRNKHDRAQATRIATGETAFLVNRTTSGIQSDTKTANKNPPAKSDVHEHSARRADPVTARPVFTLAEMRDLDVAHLDINEFTAPKQVALGEQFQVYTKAFSIGPIVSAQLEISYDPSILEFVMAREGEFVRSRGPETTASYQRFSDEGMVRIEVERQEDAASEGTVTSVTFRAISDASLVTQISLRAIGRDPAGHAIYPMIFPDALIQIVPRVTTQ